MENMVKKNVSVRKRILSTIVIVLAAVLVWGTVYASMWFVADRGELLAAYERVELRLKWDRGFAEQYGTIEEVLLCGDSGDIQRVNDHTFLIPCLVRTQNEDQYLIWAEYDIGGEKSVLQYRSIQKCE